MDVAMQEHLILCGISGRSLLKKCHLIWALKDELNGGEWYILKSIGNRCVQGT